MDYDPTQFRGTAPYYLRGRPPYSAELADVLARELRLDGTGGLLDVGCGPGTLGVALAPWFAHVTFTDPDPDMLAAARAHALASGLAEVDFVRSTAEDVAGLGLPSTRTITFGQSFHRTDAERAADAAYRVLEPGGSMVLIVHDHDRPAPPQPPDTSLIPHERVRDLVRSYLGGELRSGARPVTAYDDVPLADVVARTRFGPPRTVYAPGHADFVRDVDSVVDNYLSMSFAAPPLFGARLPEFVDDLRRLLRDVAPNGRFWDWPGDTALIIATRV